MRPPHVLYFILFLLPAIAFCVAAELVVLINCYVTFVCI